MLTYHITTRVESDGSVRLRNLPPDHRVEIFVVQPEQAEIQADMTAWFADARRGVERTPCTSVRLPPDFRSLEDFGSLSLGL